VKNAYQSTRKSTNGDLGDAFIARYGASAAPEPIPDNETGTAPDQPLNVRTAGSVTVRAASFSGDPSWTTTGTVYIGNAIIVEEGTVSLSASTLAGSGLVSLRTGAQRLAGARLARKGGLAGEEPRPLARVLGAGHVAGF